MNPKGDFKTLGLTPGASWGEVKTAFRRLARMYHPDIAGPDGARKFAEITEAYMSLKDIISPEAKSGAAGADGYAAPNARHTEETFTVSVMSSIWKRLWELLLPGKKDEGDADGMAGDSYGFSPARARFIAGAISTAEAQIAELLSRRGEKKEKNRANALIRRLRSKHPAVVLLALRQISLRDVNEEIRSAMIDHFAENIPTTEILERLLILFADSSLARDLTKVLVRHALRFSSCDARMLLRWLRRQNAGRECFAPFLNHASCDVAAAALHEWAPSFGLPEVSDLVNLLKAEDEAVLTGLLRLLRREGAPAWAIPQITRISSEHVSPSVRVWASAIVRDRNLG